MNSFIEIVANYGWPSAIVLFVVYVLRRVRGEFVLMRLLAFRINRDSLSATRNI